MARPTRRSRRAKPAAASPLPPPAPAPVPAPAEPPKPAEADNTKGSNTGLPLPRFAALRSDEVNLRAGPGTRYPIDWIYKRRELPVEILREFEVWRLVQDPEGTKGWVHQATLTGRRSFIVTAKEATLRREAQDSCLAGGDPEGGGDRAHPRLPGDFRLVSGADRRLSRLPQAQPVLGHAAGRGGRRLKIHFLFTPPVSYSGNQEIHGSRSP